MKNLVYFACMLSTICFFGACRVNVLRGEGSQNGTAAQTAPFTRIRVDVPMKVAVNIQPDSNPSYRLTGYDNILKHIKTEVKDGTLRVTSDLDETWTIDANSGTTLVVSAPTIEGMSLSGASEAAIHGTLTAPHFTLSISGACCAKIDNLHVEHFNTDISGAAEVEVDGGTADTADYEVSGAGKFKTYPLQCNNVTVAVSGAGYGQVTALKQLTAEISGTGAVKYKGHPVVTRDVSGVGTVRDDN
jgi:Putative auto-transporter adhesin, head GIN domain